MKLPFVQEVRRFEKRLLVWDGEPNQVPTKGREFIWKEKTNKNSVLILTTDSDFYQYIKQASPGEKNRGGL